MKRRDFIKHTGTLAGGLLLSSELMYAQQAGPMTVGIIGCGDRGNGIIQVMQELPELFDIAAICDVLDFRIDASKKILKKNADVHKDYRKLLDDKRIESVVIATPLNVHYPVAVAALE